MRPRNKWEPWLFSAPALIVYVCIVLVPVVWSIVYSVFDWNGISAMKFVGLQNYSRMFGDEVFVTSFFNNLFFMAVGTIYQVFTGLIMAIILTNITKGNNILRVIYFIPCIISSMAICKIFEKLLSVEPQGVLAAIMEGMGMEPIALLSEPKWALLVVTLVDGYKFCGLYMVIFYSAFMAISNDVVEAAYIDGCTWGQQYRYIKLPMIKNIFFVVLVIVINGTLKSFDVSYILTNGGPGSASELVATYTYKTAFSSTQFGYGSALSVFLLVESLVAVGIIRIFQQRAAKRD
ncbi:carbohydrate ABC transporter permease [Massiliimalia massiliensis]|uniref:carbohydrate ABC transporter permease n=1 Tax=Massiliimalia massiliensis TaxID=1852384 RepID=UPI0009860C5A|nr:sugar ABC transporter permease [Massiliimalia massiliensis]